MKAKAALPPQWRPWVLWTAVMLSLAAAGINVPHVLEHLRQQGVEDGTRYFYAALPDVLLFFGIVLVRYLPRHALGWAMLAGGVGWLVWAGLSTARATGSAKVLALAPVVVAALMALAVDLAKPGEAEAAAPVKVPAKVPARHSVKAATEGAEPSPGPVKVAGVKASGDDVKAAAKAATKAEAEARFQAFAKVAAERPDLGPKELHLATGVPMSTVERYLRKIKDEEKRDAVHLQEETPRRAALLEPR